MQRQPFDGTKARGAVSVPALDPFVEAVAHDVIGAAIEVHRHLGPGYPEKFYECALEMELQERGMTFVRQAPVSVAYKGRVIGEGLIDFLVRDVLIVELKSVDALLPVHSAQVVSYLRARQLRLGLMINFNVPVLRDGIKRVIV